MMIDPEEIWLPIPGFGGHYEASSLGRIRVKDRVIIKPHSLTGKLTPNRYKGKILSPAKRDRYGHLGVTLGQNGKDTSIAVHTLVLLAFSGPCPEGMECCHDNGIAWDNRPSNLRWDTHLANNRDRLKHGTYRLGVDHHMAKLTAEQVQKIRSGNFRPRDAERIFGISKSHFHKIKKGSAWKCLMP